MDQVNNLREIQALRRLNPHPNIILLEEVILWAAFFFIYELFFNFQYIM